MATMAMTPKASRTGFPPAALDAPSVNDNMNVDVIGPEATPPESNAIEEYIFGTINDNPKQRI